MQVMAAEYAYSLHQVETFFIEEILHLYILYTTWTLLTIHQCQALITDVWHKIVFCNGTAVTEPTEIISYQAV